MFLNQATDYAFRAVLFLAHQPDEMIVDSQTIAEREHIPTRFLLKIMPSLIRAGIIRSQRGAGGGYALARKPEAITLLDVLEAVEGPIILNRCLIDPDFCSKHGPGFCPIHFTLQGIQKNLAQEFAGYNFRQLIEKEPKYLELLQS
ncbi:MAG: Rrf2 family transcriptional regulator [Syntrophomonadaceae bacterium]|nr:Rrf2 family transcriptional regulator [Syntrophomonadaceae bacterium]